jgi:anti-sigma regulatory factor (Ser/Thr protein kinase)
MEDCLDLESKPELVAAAREFVRSRLTAWELADRIPAMTVIASELVTNAVLHARTSIQVRLSCTGRTVRIEVVDENPRLPTLAPAVPEATSGRGLSLVTQMATSWGIDNREDGKVVWAELGQPDTDDGSDDCVDLTGVDTVEEAIGEIHQTQPGAEAGPRELTPEVPPPDQRS